MVKRQALGCHAAIGELYDTRTDCFCNATMFSSLPPSTAIKTEDVELFEFRYLNFYSIVNILSMFRVEDDLKLSVASGLCEPEGLASHLFDDITATVHSKVVRGVLFTYKKKKERLYLEGGCRKHIASDVLSLTGQATHAISEVHYGINMFLYLEFKGKNASANSRNENIKNLSTIVEWYICGQPAKCKKAMTFLNRSCKVKVFSDNLASTGRHMRSVQQALDYMKKVPKLLDGIGVPLSYGLIPISTVMSCFRINLNANKQLRTVPRDIVLQVLKRFEEVCQKRLKVARSLDILEKYISVCMGNEDTMPILTMRNSAEFSSTGFHRELAALLVEVRSGSEHPLKLQDFCEQVLMRLNSAFSKAKFAYDMLKRGVRYIDKDDLLDDFVQQGQDVHVLHHSTKERNAFPFQWNYCRKEFVKIVGYPKTTGVLFDHDFDGSGGANRIGIDSYRNGRAVDPADGKDGLKAQGLLCYAESPEVGPAALVLKRKACLMLPCPGASVSVAGVDKARCCSASKTWHCRRCQSEFFYGFDEAFHCFCGSAPCWSFRFKCNDLDHGADYLPAPWPWPDLFGQSRFAQTLRCLTPMREKKLNILLLGETGVGKSTWMSSFLNYLTYKTMEEAERIGLRYLNGSKFLVPDDECRADEVKTEGAENGNSKGQSTTQIPKSYAFTARELMVQLIDTPGVGDTRGLEQDKMNIQNILSQLADLEDIHGICILLKSDIARMSIAFQFCIKELLTHLHKDASKNIVFVFTDSCENFYRSGGTFSTLRNLLLENKDIGIKLGKKTVYCMDNEAVRFLAASKQGKIFRPEESSSSSINWKTSVAENERFLQHILSLTSHSVKKTMVLNQARRVVLGLTEPLAQIKQNIQNDIVLAQSWRDELNAMVKISSELKPKLDVVWVDVETKSIPYPRIVCTSSGCTESIAVGGLTKVNCKTRCHELCFLKNVQVQNSPCPKLQNCTAMANADSCKVCGCTWDAHMCITYKCVKVKRKTVDKKVEWLLKDVCKSNRAVETFIKDVELRIANQRREL